MGLFDAWFGPKKELIKNKEEIQAERREILRDRTPETSVQLPGIIRFEIHRLVEKIVNAQGKQDAIEQSLFLPMIAEETREASMETREILEYVPAHLAQEFRFQWNMHLHGIQLTPNNRVKAVGDILKILEHETLAECDRLEQILDYVKRLK